MMLKIGTKLTIYLSITIILILSGYGYLNILSQRDIHTRKMKLEARTIGETLGVSLAKTSISEKEYVQSLINAIEEYEKTLGVIIYLKEQNLIFKSRSVQDGFEPYLKTIDRAIEGNRPEMEFGFYKKLPVFWYTFPIRNSEGESIGGGTIFQHVIQMERDIKKAEWSVLVTTFILTGTIVLLVLYSTKKWVSKPLFQLGEGIKHIAKGNLSARIDLKTGSEEIANVVKAFNQMAVDLKKARDQFIQEAETKLSLERALRQSEKLAIVGRLASELAHEIRTPLTSINIFVQSLEKERGRDENRAEDFRIIKKEIDRINENITRLLNFAKPEEPQLQDVDLHELLKDRLHLLMPKIKRNNIQINLSLADSLPPLKGDVKQLGQVLLNLILNAIESMPQGGTLTIHSAIETDSDGREKCLRMEIQDTGHGIPEGNLPYLFDPFFTTKEGGTGLGLSIAFSLVEKHHGCIEVKSRMGQGASFILTLPFRKET